MGDSSSEQSEPTYDYIEETESLELYSHGGYHPVKIGDNYSKGRYHVIHKLGYGSYSTVWLARDSRLQRYVALKVLIADEISNNSELKVSERLEDDCIGRRQGKIYVRSYLDNFLIDGPNGRHVCLVSAIARHSVAFSKDASTIRIFQIDVARAITAQAILGLRYIHDKGVVHGGG